MQFVPLQKYFIHHSRRLCEQNTGLWYYCGIMPDHTRNLIYDLWSTGHIKITITLDIIATIGTSEISHTRTDLIA